VREGGREKEIERDKIGRERDRYSPAAPHVKIRQANEAGR